MTMNGLGVGSESKEEKDSGVCGLGLCEQGFLQTNAVPVLGHLLCTQKRKGRGRVWAGRYIGHQPRQNTAIA